MGKSLSRNLRARVVSNIRDDHSARLSGWVFGESMSTAVR